MARQEDIYIRLSKIRALLTELLTASSESEKDKRKENVERLEEIGRELQLILEALRADALLETGRGKGKITNKRRRDLDLLIASVRKLQRLDADLRRQNLVPNNLAVYAELLHHAEETDKEEAQAHLERLQIFAETKGTSTHSEIGPRYNLAEAEPRPVFVATSYVILGLALVVRYMNRKKSDRRGHQA